MTTAKAGIYGHTLGLLVLAATTEAPLAAAARPALTSDTAAADEAAALQWSSSGWMESASGSNACDVKDFGAVGDNRTDDTLAIQKAIDGCRKEHQEGAVVVLSGPAVYRVTASIELGSNLTLLIAKDTMLYSAKTPPMPCNETLAKSSGITCASVPHYTPMPVAQNPRCPTLFWPTKDTGVLCGANLTNVAVLGADQNTSIVDGGGIPWYRPHPYNRRHFKTCNELHSTMISMQVQCQDVVYHTQYMHAVVA